MFGGSCLLQSIWFRKFNKFCVDIFRVKRTPDTSSNNVASLGPFFMSLSIHEKGAEVIRDGY